MKSKTKLFALLLGVVFLIPTGILAQYNIDAGKNVITKRLPTKYYNEESGLEEIRYEVKRLFQIAMEMLREMNMILLLMELLKDRQLLFFIFIQLDLIFHCQKKL